VVFSEAYREAIEQTPHIKCKSPPLVKWLADSFAADGAAGDLRVSAGRSAS